MALRESLNRIEDLLVAVNEDCRRQLAKLSDSCCCQKLVFQQPSKEAVDSVNSNVNVEHNEAVISQTELLELENLLEKAKIAAHQWENQSRRRSLPDNISKRRNDGCKLPPLKKDLTSDSSFGNRQKQSINQTVNKDEVLDPQKMKKKTSIMKAVSSKSKRDTTYSSKSLTSRSAQVTSSFRAISGASTGAIPKRSNVASHRAKDESASLLRIDLDDMQQQGPKEDDQHSEFIQRKEKLNSALRRHQLILSRAKKHSSTSSIKYKKLFLQMVESTEEAAHQLSSVEIHTAGKYKILFQKMSLSLMNDMLKSEINSSIARCKRSVEKIEADHKEDEQLVSSTLSCTRLFEDAVIIPTWLWHRSIASQFGYLPTAATYMSSTDLLQFGTLLHEVQWFHLQVELHKLFSSDILPILISMDLNSSTTLSLFKCLYSILCEDGSKFPILLKDAT